MNKRSTMLLLLASCSVSAVNAAEGNGTNVLLIMADDLGYEEVGCLQAGIPDLTPNMDKFAAQGMMFKHAHSNTPICQPSRSIVATGRYGYTSGMMGFIHMKKKSSTTMERFQQAGYLTGILGKVNHSTPDMHYKWDFVHDYAELGAGRSPSKYAAYCSEFFDRAKAEQKPFFLMVNSHDPHRPFHDPNGKKMKGAEEPSKLFTQADVRVPTHLPDIPQIRKEMSHYYNSVRRFDDTVGKVLEALEQSGMRDKTIVTIISDNGAAVPFAKANVYLASTRSPWLMQWPGKIKPGQKDTTNFISFVDYFPTMLEAAEIPIPKEVDGRSILPLTRGVLQSGRDIVFTQVDYKIGGPACPMRCIQNEKYAYIFNPWSRKGANYRNSNEGKMIKAMEASGDPELLERVRMFRDRVVEEFYDLEKDPGCTNNLIDNPEYAITIKQYTEKLYKWMQETNDPVLPLFDLRSSETDMTAYIKKDFPQANQLKPKEQIEEQRRKAAAKKKNRSQKK